MTGVAILIPGNFVRPAAANLSISRPDLLPQIAMAPDMSVSGTLTVNCPLASSKPNVKRDGRTSTVKMGLPQMTPMLPQPMVMVLSRPPWLAVRKTPLGSVCDTFGAYWSKEISCMAKASFDLMLTNNLYSRLNAVNPATGRGKTECCVVQNEAGRNGVGVEATTDRFAFGKYCSFSGDSSL